MEHIYSKTNNSENMRISTGRGKNRGEKYYISKHAMAMNFFCCCCSLKVEKFYREVWIHTEQISLPGEKFKPGSIKS